MVESGRASSTPSGSAKRETNFEQPRAGVQAVVEAVPALLEEDVAAHLAGQRRAGLLQLGLDQRMAGFPHQRLAAVVADPAGEVAVHLTS